MTIGNELVSGDVENTNASWLARRLERLGLGVRLVAAVPDDVDLVAALVRSAAVAEDYVVATGGLGGTPDDLTRESVAAAFGVARAEVLELANELRARFPRDPEYVARWAELPVGSRPLRNARRRAGLRDRERVRPSRPAFRDGRRCSSSSQRSWARRPRSPPGAAATGRGRARSWPCSSRRASAGRR